MVSRSSPTLDIRYPAAFAAGLTAALLCLVVRQGTLPALLTACLSPLPIMLATFAFGGAPGLTAAAIGTGTIIFYFAASAGDIWTARLVSAALFGAIFAMVLGFPAWWLARLARLSRTEPGFAWRDAPWPESDGRVSQKAIRGNSYPLSRILAYTVLGAAAIITSTLIVISLRNGGFAAIVDRSAAWLAPYIVDTVSMRELPAGIDLQYLSRFYIRLIPPLVTSSYVLLLAANLWLAGRVVQASNLLLRSWPDIAGELRLPRALALGFLASLASCLFDGLVGAIASCAAAALGTGFVLQGLAVMHALSRGIKFRAALLAAIYAAAAVPPFLMLIPFALLGLLDAGFGFRERRPGALPQKT